LAPAVRQRSRRASAAHPARSIRPAAAYRQRGRVDVHSCFGAPESWHEPVSGGRIRYVVQKPGHGYLHPVTVEDVRERIAQLPDVFRRTLEVVQFSSMTRKRHLFPCYGMQWGQNVYLYPMEASLVEVYVRPPQPQQLIEARMFGGEWSEHDGEWRLTWTPESIRDFYLNNVLIHEIGHVVDTWNTNAERREQYANWFAIEYGYRHSRGRR
jgi:hypothetical protein